MTIVKNIKGENIDFEAAVNIMSDDLREQLAAEGFESDQEFFEAYAELHAEKFGEDFAPFAGGEW